MKMNEKRNRRKIASGFTIRKRFASGLDLAYCITFPLVIHSERMKKERRSADIETPNKEEMFE